MLCFLYRTRDSADQVLAYVQVVPAALHLDGVASAQLGVILAVKRAAEHAGYVYRS